MTHEQLMAALATIGTDQPFPDHLFPAARPPIKASAPKWERAYYQGRTRIDHEGVWDELPPDQDLMSRAHFVDSDNVCWVLRPAVRSNKTPKDKYANSVDLRARARAKVEELAATLPEDHPDVIRGRELLDRCHRNSMAALAEFEKWQEDGLDPELNTSPLGDWDTSTVEGRNRRNKEVNEYHKTEIGRRERNAKRRKVRSASNADLSGANEEERAEHKRRQAAERMKKMRAKKKAAASGDLSAAIS